MYTDAHMKYVINIHVYINHVTCQLGGTMSNIIFGCTKLEFNCVAIENIPAWVMRHTRLDLDPSRIHLGADSLHVDARDKDTVFIPVIHTALSFRTFPLNVHFVIAIIVSLLLKGQFCSNARHTHVHNQLKKQQQQQHFNADTQC